MDLFIKPRDQGDDILTARSAPSEEFEQVHPAFSLLALANPGVPKPEQSSQFALSQTGALPHGNEFRSDRRVVW